MTMTHWIRLSLLCRCKWTRKSQVSYRNVSEQYLLWWKDKRVYCVYTRIVSTKEIPRRTKKKLQNLLQITRFLCMHKILVHAQECCACMHKTALFLGPGLGPWPLQCMHKSVVHAQECCACTRILCMHKNLDFVDKNFSFSWYVFHLCIIHLFMFA